MEKTSYSQNIESKSKVDLEKTTHVTIKISGKANRLLNAAVTRSGRRKTQEARVRLEDHLIRYQSVSEINNATKFEEE